MKDFEISRFKDWEINLTVIRIAAQASINEGFHIDTALNGIPLASTRHSGSHPTYTQNVENLLNQIDLYQPHNDVYNAVRSKINTIKAAINQNPGTNINLVSF